MFLVAEALTHLSTSNLSRGAQSSYSREGFSGYLTLGFPDVITPLIFAALPTQPPF